jgi:6-phosphofructokinase 1
MGRDAGYIALNSGIACGAEDILIPETETHINELLARIEADGRRKKAVQIIVVAEGDDFGGAKEVHEAITARFPSLDVRACVLGHIQRGGSPSYADRVLASRMGHAAVNALTGVVNGALAYTPFDKVIKGTTPIAPDLIEMIRVLSV